MARREVPAEVLATRWSAPLLPDGSAGQPLLCVATTFGLHAALLENDLLPRFLGFRYDGAESERAYIVEREQRLAEVPVHVLVDAGHVDPGQSTLRWAQLPVRIRGAFQHAKVTLLLWERCARVIVASANLTTTGYRRNREVAGVLDFFDGPLSTPLAQGFEVIDFLELLAEFAVAAPQAIARLRDGLGTARARLRRWKAAPADVGPREVPRVHFVAGHPRSPTGEARRSVLDQALAIWGDRRTSQLGVVTPFVGEVSPGPNPVAAKLAAIPRTRGACATLAVPGHDAADGKQVTVELPRQFLDGWAEAWGVEPSDVPVVVPRRVREGEMVTRNLHAKAVFLESEADDRALLLAGSSNFTLHGMGVGVLVPNVEANLCYVARLEDALRDRVPVLWEEEQVEDEVWLAEPEAAAEDEGRGDVLPEVFRWATYDQRGHVVTVELDPSHPLPSRWSIRLPGRSETDEAVLGDERSFPEMPDGGTLRLPLPSAFGTATLGSLRVSWVDDDGTPRSAALVLQVAEVGDLLPPEEFRTMSADAIIDALLTGREPGDLVEADESRRSRVGVSPATGSLRAVDTSTWMLYRVRRLGRALAGLGERISRTIRTRDAMTYRLLQDPLGPVHLAEALVREWLPEVATRAEKDPVMFGIAEIALTVIHAGARVKNDREAGEPDLRPLFRDTADRLFAMCAAHAPAFGAAQIVRYVREVRKVARQRLG